MRNATEAVKLASQGKPYAKADVEQLDVEEMDDPLPIIEELSPKRTGLILTTKFPK